MQHGMVLVRHGDAAHAVRPVAKSGYPRGRLREIRPPAVLERIAHSDVPVQPGVNKHADDVRAKRLPCVGDPGPFPARNHAPFVVDKTRQNRVHVHISPVVAPLRRVFADADRPDEAEPEFADAGIRQADVHFGDLALGVCGRRPLAIFREPPLRREVVRDKHVNLDLPRFRPHGRTQRR